MKQKFTNSRSFDDALARGYKVVTVGGSAWEDLLKLAPPGTSRRRYYDARMRGDPSTTNFYTPDEVIDMTLSEPKTLMWDTSFYVVADKRMRALNIIDSSISHAPFAFQKGSEFQSLFDYHLMKMKQSGIFERVNLEYTPDHPLTIGVTEADQLGYNNLLFPMIVLSFGGFGALIILLLEGAMKYLATKYPTKQDEHANEAVGHKGWQAHRSRRVPETNAGTTI